jgi:quinol monooxygenase YgiN
MVISRFRYDAEATEQATQELSICLEQLGAQAGFATGSIGRAIDDPTLWLLYTRWEDVGSYRRALSTYDVKAVAVPLLSQAVDEPSAYEIIVGDGATEPNRAQPRRL